MGQRVLIKGEWYARIRVPVTFVSKKNLRAGGKVCGQWSPTLHSLSLRSRIKHLGAVSGVC